MLLSQLTFKCKTDKSLKQEAFSFSSSDMVHQPQRKQGWKSGTLLQGAIQQPMARNERPCHNQHHQTLDSYRLFPAGLRGSRIRLSRAAAGSWGEPRTVGRDRERGRERGRLPCHCQQSSYSKAGASQRYQCISSRIQALEGSGNILYLPL